jgi:hypothetical protein
MKTLFAALLFAQTFLFAQTRFDGTWEMRMDTLEFTGPPEDYLLSDGMYHCLSCLPKLDVKADGTKQKVTGQLHFDTMLVRVVDAHSVAFAYWKNGTHLPVPKPCRQTECPRPKSSPRIRLPKRSPATRCSHG